jgi:septum formation protein
MILLASQSPRRRELLHAAAIPFVVRVPEVDESRAAGETPSNMVLRLALLKARAAMAGSLPPEVRAVLAADTTVSLDDTEPFEKPRNPADAVRMLRALAGRTHRVDTGWCLLHPHGQVLVHVLASARVTFRSLDDADIERYVASGEPMDKAGAYAIQGGALAFVTHLEGDLAAIIGLPIARVVTALRDHGLA